MSNWQISLGNLDLMDATYCVYQLDTTTVGRARVTLYIDGPDEQALIDAVRMLEQQVNLATRLSMPTSVAHWLTLSVKPEGSETVRYAVRKGTVTVPRTQVGGIHMANGWIDGVLLDLECLEYTLGEPIELESQVVTGRQPWFEIAGIPGDVPALVEMRIADQSEGSVINRVLVGSRSGDAEYTPVLPFVDSGNPEDEDDDTFSGWIATGDAESFWTTIGQMAADPIDGSYDFYARVNDSTAFLGDPGIPQASFSAGIIPRQSIWGNAFSGPSVSTQVTFTQDSLAGSLIVAICSSTGGGAITTPTGFTQALNTAHPGGNGPRLAIYYLVDAPAMSSLTVTHASDVVQMMLLEFPGIATTSPLDVQNSATANATTTGSTGSTGTLDQAYNLALAAFTTHGGPSIPGYAISNPPSGWTSVVQSWGAPDLPFAALSIWRRITTSTTAISESATIAANRNWVGGVAVFKGAIATVPDLAAGTYAFCVAAVDGDGGVSAASDIVTITTPATGAVYLEWPAASGPVVKYRVYRRAGSGSWGYWETDTSTPSYIVYGSSGASAGNPPEWSTIEQADVRLQLALESGATIDLATPPYTSQIANSAWEPALLHRGPVPAAPELFNRGETGWMTRLQAISTVSRTVSADALILMPADEQQIDVRYMAGNLATPREWVIGTTPAMRTYAWLRDLDTGHEAGRLHALGYCLMGPGDTTVVLLMTTAGGVWQIEDVEAEVSMTVIPRYRWLAGGV